MLDRILGRSKRLGEKSAAGEKKPEIKIGVVACKTGPTANYGLTALQGLELGIEYATHSSGQVNGHPIRLLVEDDNCNPDLSVLRANELCLKQGVDILQSCTISGAAVRLIKVAKEQKRLCMVAVAATGVLTGEWRNRYVFRTASTTYQDASAGGKYAAEHLGKRFCFFSPDYIWGHQSRSAWWQVVERYPGVQIIGDILAPANATIFGSYLDEVRTKNPDVLVPFWVGSVVPWLYTQMLHHGLLDKVRVAGNLPDRQGYIDSGQAMKGFICAVKYSYEFPQNAVNNWFVRRHQEKFGSPPDTITESGFTSGVALVRALEQTGGDPDPEGLIMALEGMKFEGPKGIYTLRKEDHQALQTMYVAEMVPAAGHSYCIPHLLEDVSPEASAPPIIHPRE